MADKQVSKCLQLIHQACFYLGQARGTLNSLGRGRDLGKRLDKIAQELDKIQQEIKGDEP